jgi:peptide/nickel transport system permease protein
VVQAIVIVFATVFIFTNLVVDILYAYLDPRIRYQ